MKINRKFLSVVLLACMHVMNATDNVIPSTTIVVEKSAVETVATPHVHTCACGPTEHWFHKSCVKNYNKQFIGAGLLENNDTEGLSANVVQAIEMLAANITFIAENGTAIVPTLNAKGVLLLPMFKNLDYKLCKDILRKVDVRTTLSAQELYQQWSHQLKIMKSAQ